MPDHEPRYGPARLRLAGGRARLHPPGPVPEGMVAGRFSVLSPGTERRHLAATVHGPARGAGYMGLGRSPQGWVLAPAPHGAPFRPTAPGVLTVPHGTGAGVAAVAAVARFQLMAELGLDRLPAGTDLHDAVVVGSGPVALGCALALRRRGAGPVRVLTRRSDPPIARVPGVRCTATMAGASAAVVIDATGHPERAAGLVAPGETLGLLGTPAPDSAVSARDAHRGGWTVIGMHELAPARGQSRTDAYQHRYTEAVSWLVEHLDPRLVDSWCETVPGQDAPAVLATLGRPDRPAAPVVLFDWSR